MSDDTPTQRLPEPDDAPTRRLDAGPPSEPAGGDDTPGEQTPSHALLIALIAIGSALLLAVVVLVIVLFTDDADPQADPTPVTTRTESPEPSPTPTASDSPRPSATPSSAPTQAPPPPPPASPIVSYTASTQDADCPDDAAAVPITFNWNTTGSEVSFGIATDFADSQPYESGLPAVGGITVDYQCSNPETKFSIAVFHNGGVIDRETIVVRAD